MREFDVLSHIYAANPKLDGRVLIPPGDDMGMVAMRGTDRKILAAVDQLIDGRHVRLALTPIELVGRKAITRSLSDIAAMGANPLATLVAATLPPDFGQDRADLLFDSMRTTAEHYDCPLIGGDLAFHTHADNPLICAVTVLAEPLEGCAVARRDGAEPGQNIFVTGHLGGSLQTDGLGRHLTFEPRITLGMELVRMLGRNLGAMIDISDGLGRDASHIAELSNVQMRFRAERVPCNPGCDWMAAFKDGEDYELCFTAHGDIPSEMAGVAITKVGEVWNREPFSPAVLIQDGLRFITGDDLGWQHQS
jgi:thiamine-monophosphate kinase